MSLNGYKERRKEATMKINRRYMAIHRRAARWSSGVGDDRVPLAGTLRGAGVEHSSMTVQLPLDRVGESRSARNY